ncbi:MAG: hypothetical protein AB7K71_23745 [Polyangiaceae bacterium]
MATPVIQSVSLNVSHVGLVTSVGPGLLSSVFFAEAGLKSPVASPFFKPRVEEEELDEPPEPIAIEACPWLEPRLALADRLARLTLRAAHEALDAWRAGDETRTTPTVWLVVSKERVTTDPATTARLNEVVWRELRPRNVRILEEETGAMLAVQEIHAALSAGEPAALLIGVDSFFSPQVAAKLASCPASRWEPEPSTPSEGAAAVLFTARASRHTSLSASRASTLGVSQVPSSIVDPMGATSLATSRLSSSALGADRSAYIARVVAVGAATGISSEDNEELQDGLAMTALVEGLNAAIRPELVVGPSNISLFRSREWEMAACRAPDKLSPNVRHLDVSTLFGWLGAASAVAGLVYSIAGTRLGLLKPEDGNWLTAAVWGVSAQGVRGLLAVMTESQGEQP